MAKPCVVWIAFAGRTRIEQHKLVYEVFGDEIGGPIHALSLKTQTQGEQDATAAVGEQDAAPAAT